MNWISEIIGLAGVSESARLVLVYWWSKAPPAEAWARASVDIEPRTRESGSRVGAIRSCVFDIREHVHPTRCERRCAEYLAELRVAGLVEVDGHRVVLVPPADAKPMPAKPEKLRTGPKVTPKRKKSPPRVEPQPTGLFPMESARDYAREVFDALNNAVIKAKRDLGISPAGPAATTLSSKRRSAIEARIKDHGGGQRGVDICLRVISVDERQCRHEGPDGHSWNWWNADTPFLNPTNFDQRLNRWRENGRHVLSTRSKPTDANKGAMQRHGQDDQLNRYSAVADAADPKDRP